MRNTSTIHIKTDFDCKVYYYGQEIGNTKAGTYFNIELRRGEHELSFAFTENETISKTISYTVEDVDCDYQLNVEIAEAICEKAEELDGLYWSGLYCYYDENALDYGVKAYHLYQYAAEKGLIQAQYKLGIIYSDESTYGEMLSYSSEERYLHGNHRKEDLAIAAKWFAKAAKQGHVQAQYSLGDCYYYGKGLKEDLAKAVEWFAKAASQGNEEAQYSLGYCYYHGQGIEEDLAKAVEWYKKAAKQGDRRAQFEIGCCYECGDGVEEDPTKAVEWYKKAAKQGHADAQYRLGICCEYGNGIEKNLTKAVEWYATAAKRGCIEALCEMGFRCAIGNGINKDIDKAKEWLTKAAEKGNETAQCFINAEKGNAEAQFEMGECYSCGQGLDGYGFIKDDVIAVEWYTKSAMQGCPKAQYELGCSYKCGRGVEKNAKKAIEWFAKAAKQGHSESQKQLGLCYNDGYGVKQNPQKAIEWLTEAIQNGSDPNVFTVVFWDWIEKEKESGNRLAQYNIGYWLENVYGTNKDIQEAIEWYAKAAKQGHEEAQKALKRLNPNKIKSIKYLFFDTETTGIPRDYKAPTSNLRNWPRLVQLSWITTDKECNILSKNDHIIYPGGFTIPADVARLHGITTSIAQKKGEPLEEVVEMFMKDFNTAKIIVGHNIAFDKKIIGAELVRLGQKDIMNTKKSICTMESSTDYCKIPGKYGYKWPTLQELHKKLFGCEFKDAHNSMSDVTATLKCFKKMKELGII